MLLNFGACQLLSTKSQFHKQLIAHYFLFSHSKGVRIPWNEAQENVVF